MRFNKISLHNLACCTNVLDDNLIEWVYMWVVRSDYLFEPNRVEWNETELNKIKQN